MLKISFAETPLEKKWVLEGRLKQPWVRELKASWRKNYQTGKRRPCIVDLNEVTFIDKSGMRLLYMLARDGAQFTASGIYTKHVIEQLKARRKPNLSNVLSILFVASLSMLLSILTSAPDAKCQNTVINASVPSGPACDQVVRLTLRDALMALKYNLGAIEPGERPRLRGTSNCLRLASLKRFSITDDRRANTPRMYLYVDAEHHTAIPLRSVSLHRKPRPARSCEEFPYADS
jgi:ABC-type transporter Mla MlaB component